ncbi:transglutaminase domain-containing protein [Mycoplasma sp. OR1901]|uniref:transglutaminase domain-containing protein n=1 Tax=Mycoplasma sp. OR1901 TaxID=2742195 RepID=UPI001583CAA0|nr:transglutaminase domain-containing protein [Mycoplasma sp. OR1901]QKT05139.1 hypothetical protein HTZ87_00185 [Mycoplasma sp. OR1901]
MKKSKIFKKILIPFLGTSPVFIISCSSTNSAQKEETNEIPNTIVDNSTSNNKEVDNNENTDSNNQQVNDKNQTEGSSNSEVVEEVPANKNEEIEDKSDNSSSNSEVDNNENTSSENDKSEPIENPGDNSTNNGEQDNNDNQEKIKQEVIETYSNIINEQEKFINLLKTTKGESNSEFKYEILFDSINQVTENFDKLEKPLKYDNEELDKYNESYKTLEVEFNKMVSLKETLKLNADTAPQYYAGNFDKNAVKKEENESKNDYSNYPELDAIEKSTKDGNRQKNEVNALINKKALEFVNLSKENLSDFNDNGYNPSQKAQLTKFLEDEVIKDEKNKKEQIFLVFKWITKHVKYANDVRSAKLNPFEVKQFLSAVCGGYSILYKSLLDILGIKTVMVIGWSSAGAHQWNAIQDPETNEWFFSDATWGTVSERYFRLTADQISNDHRVERVLDLNYFKDNITYEYWNGLSVKDANIDSPNIPDKLNDILVENISDTILNNNKVKTLNIPEFVKHIEYPGTKGTYAFEVSKDNKFFASQNGILYSKDFSRILMTPSNLNSKTVTIPKETSTLNDGKDLFESNSVSEIIVEPGNYSFASYKGVLYNNDFSQIISIPNGTTNLVVHPDVKFQGQEISFKDNLRTVTLSEGITVVEDFTFNTLNRLEYVIFPSTIKEIKNEAFLGIRNVTLKTHEDNEIVRDFAKKHNFKYEVIVNN